MKIITLNEAIDIVDRLLSLAKDDVCQYGGEPKEDEDVIDGERLLEQLRLFSRLKGDI